MWYATLAIMMGLLIIGCDIDPSSDPIENSEIAGRYSADFLPSGEAAYLELRSDSTFIHDYRDTGGKVYEDTGTWSLYVRWDGLHYITLDSLVRRYPVTLDSLRDCYCSEGTIDTSKTRQVFPLYKKYGKQYLRACYKPQQRYVKERSGSQ